jgi:hypothetical protein
VRPETGSPAVPFALEADDPRKEGDEQDPCEDFGVG